MTNSANSTNYSRTGQAQTSERLILFGSGCVFSKFRCQDTTTALLLSEDGHSFSFRDNNCNIIDQTVPNATSLTKDILSSTIQFQRHVRDDLPFHDSCGTQFETIENIQFARFPTPAHSRFSECCHLEASRSMSLCSLDGYTRMTLSADCTTIHLTCPLLLSRRSWKPASQQCAEASCSNSSLQYIYTYAQNQNTFSVLACPRRWSFALQLLLRVFSQDGGCRYCGGLSPAMPVVCSPEMEWFDLLPTEFQCNRVGHFVEEHGGLIISDVAIELASSASFDKVASDDSSTPMSRAASRCASFKACIQQSSSPSSFDRTAMVSSSLLHTSGDILDRFSVHCAHQYTRLHASTALTVGIDLPEIWHGQCPSNSDPRFVSITSSSGLYNKPLSLEYRRSQLAQRCALLVQCEWTPDATYRLVWHRNADRRVHPRVEVCVHLDSSSLTTTIDGLFFRHHRSDASYHLYTLADVPPRVAYADFEYVGNQTRRLHILENRIVLATISTLAWLFHYNSSYLLTPIARHAKLLLQHGFEFVDQIDRDDQLDGIVTQLCDLQHSKFVSHSDLWRAIAPLHQSVTDPSCECSPISILRLVLMNSANEHFLDADCANTTKTGLSNGADLLDEVHCVGLAHFNFFRDGRCTANYFDRTLVYLSADRTRARLVLSDASTLELRIPEDVMDSAPVLEATNDAKHWKRVLSPHHVYLYQSYIRPCLEFVEWSALTPSQRLAQLQQQSANKCAIEANLDETRRLLERHRIKRNYRSNEIDQAFRSADSDDQHDFTLVSEIDNAVINVLPHDVASTSDLLTRVLQRKHAIQELLDHS